MRTKPALLVVLLAAAGCGPALPTAPYSPLEVQTDQPAEALYNAAIRTLVRFGYGFAERDVGAFAIETKYIEVFTGYSASSYSYSWRIITAGGTLSIFASCKVYKGGQCSSDKYPERVINEQERLRAEIIDDAASTPAGGGR